MKTVSRVYDTYAHAKQAVQDVQATGVPSSAVSLVANKYASDKYENVETVSKPGTGAGIGGVLGGSAGLLAGLGMLAIPGLGPVVAVGWLASLAVGAAAGATAGGLVGALVSAGTPDEQAHVYSESVRRGGTLVSVRVEDADAVTVQAILDSHGPIDPVARGAEYRSTGWKTFDPAAPPYEPSETEIERDRRNRAA
jgi:hypothetical protein